jgi:hypothetical protein
MSALSPQDRTPFPPHQSANRFDVVGYVAADGARLKEDLTNIDSWSLGLHKGFKGSRESFWNFSADSNTLGQRFAGMSAWRDAFRR